MEKIQKLTIEAVFDGKRMRTRLEADGLTPIMVIGALEKIKMDINKKMEDEDEDEQVGGLSGGIPDEFIRGLMDIIKGERTE